MVALLAGLGYPEGPAGALVEMIDELDGAAVIFTNIQLADWTVETGGLSVVIRSVCDDVQTSLVAGTEMLFEKFSLVKYLIAEMTGKESGSFPA